MPLHKKNLYYEGTIQTLPDTIFRILGPLPFHTSVTPLYPDPCAQGPKDNLLPPLIVLNNLWTASKLLVGLMCKLQVYKLSKIPI